MSNFHIHLSSFQTRRVQDATQRIMSENMSTNISPLITSLKIKQNSLLLIRNLVLECAGSQWRKYFIQPILDYSDF